MPGIYKNIKDFVEYKQFEARLIAIDYGQKKTGVAISDRGLNIASPHKVIVAKSFDYLIYQLTGLIKQNQYWGIVIGYPLLSSGVEGNACKIVEILAKLICTKFKLPVLLFDERGTTAQANEILEITDFNRKKRNLIDDKIAASIILDKVLRQL